MARRRFSRSTRTTYGKPFTTRRGKLGRYKYINGRRVSFQTLQKRFTKRKRY